MPDYGDAIAEIPAAASIFAALGDPVRLAIVARLSCDGPLPTIALTQSAGGVSRQGVTKHLLVLEQAGLVSSDRVGRDRQWRIEAQRLAALRDHLERLSAEWVLRVERLRRFVEDEPD
jgi:DNA-binding transcriptional ArsR family regulator